MPTNKISWEVKYPEYSPTNFTSEKIKGKTGSYGDPDV